MTAPGSDWPSDLSDLWSVRQQAQEAVQPRPEVEGLITLIAGMYRDEDIRASARTYVQQVTDADQPGWAAAGCAVWALALWRGGEDDAALLQLILAELHLQDEFRSPRYEPPGGPTGAGAACNNLGVAYAAMEMFELAEPHLERATQISSRDYGRGLELQVCADLANLAETRVRWALYREAVAGGQGNPVLAARARADARRFLSYARSLGRGDAVRFARTLQIAVLTVSQPAAVTMSHRDELLDALRLPVFGDEPGEVLMRAVTARVCRLVGDVEQCWQQSDRVRRLNPAAYHASTIIALSEAARAEGASGHVWDFANAVAAESDATRKRIMTAFQARLGLAGLEQRFEEVSRERRTLQRALQEALRQEAELVHAATHDSLTGLPNRALFEQHLASVLDSEAEERPSVVAHVDVDDFRHVNDTHGHSAGDRVLRWLAERLRAFVADAGVVARLGGDEFAILLRSRSAEEAWNWPVQALAAVLEADPPFGVTASVGMCVVPSQATVEEVLHLADSQMYEAKRQRKVSGRSAGAGGAGGQD